ncbi:MAG: DUF1080 domain-containing protein [Lewinellaceae bacterium]|nr:DUF1080 domain-containing protein [Lewinellaceae bacterium]
MKQIPIILLAVITSFALYSCNSSAEKTPASETEATVEKPATTESDWIALFDGSSTQGWRGFNQETLPENWVIEEGTLKSLGTGGDIGGDIVYGDREFEDFELSLEWKISDGGNSGIFYHVLEGEQYKAPYENAPEYQLIDDIGFPEKLEDWQQVGADYAMYPADPAKKIVKKAGEWNTSRIVFRKEKAEYWLNGQKVVEFVPWSDDWMARRNSGKWDDYPDYGKAEKGLIALQDHGSFIWFRNIKIREL